MRPSPTSAQPDRPPGAPALEVDGLTVGYSPGLDVLHEVSLTVPAGGLCGLVGLNGAGKSTLLKAICGFLRPRAGRICLFGEPILGMPPHRALQRGLYLVPQESGLFPYLTVAENLDAVARRRHRPVEEAYRRFPALWPLRRRKVGDLSGGQQKMVEFARGLLAGPRLVLVDEPAVGLAPAVAREVHGWLRQFQAEGIAVLWVDHNLPAVVELADYVYVLSLGRITAHGPARQLARDLRGQLRQWLGFEAPAVGAGEPQIRKTSTDLSSS